MADETEEIDHWVQLGQVIRDGRARSGLTQQALAEKAGVSRAWLARVESGHRKAEIEFVMRALGALDLSLAVVSRTPRDVDPELAEALRRAGLE